MTPEGYVIEPYARGDERLVIDSWCASEWQERRGRVSDQVFKGGMRARVARLLEGSLACVARIPGFQPPDDIAGACVYGWDRGTHRPVIHYLYVKPAHRRQGLAGALARAAGHRGASWCTHCPAELLDLIESKGVIHNPFLLDGAVHKREST